MSIESQNIIKELTVFGVDIKEYSIVCDKQAPRGVLDAVEEFKNRIFEATGVMMPTSAYDKNLCQILLTRLNLSEKKQMN